MANYMQRNYARDRSPYRNIEERDRMRFMRIEHEGRFWQAKVVDPRDYASTDKLLVKTLTMQWRRGLFIEMSIQLRPTERKSVKRLYFGGKSDVLHPSTMSLGFIHTKTMRRLKYYPGFSHQS